MADRRKKPRGTIGTTMVRFDGSGTLFTPVILPGPKEEIESAIVKAAFRPEGIDLRKFYRVAAEPVREAGLDFRLATSSGVEYLELMEVAILEPSRGSYEGVSDRIRLGERIEGVYEQVLKKVVKYGRTRGHTIHLLLYTTDWHFSLAGPEGDLLAHLLNRREHCFGTVVYCRPMSSAPITVWERILFPLSEAEV